jgi:hypothetical protein
MTVNYMRNLKESIDNSTDNYENGYQHCSEEIWKLIHSLPNIYPDQRQYLANRCRQMWTNRRLKHHPYQRQSIEQKCLRIIVNDSCSSSPKLWKPYI